MTGLKKLLMWKASGGGGGGLPGGYTRLDHINNGSGGAYIDTGLIVERGSIIALTFNQPQDSANRALFGYRYSGTYADGKNIMIYVDAGNRFILVGVRTGTSGTGSTDCFAFGEKTTLVIDSAQEKIYVNGIEATFDSNFSKAFDETEGTSLYAPYIGGYNNAGSVGGRTYSCLFYGYRVEKNGAVLMDMVPAKSPDNVIGMYDRIGNRFYSSANSAQFTDN